MQTLASKLILLVAACVSLSVGLLALLHVERVTKLAEGSAATIMAMTARNNAIAIEDKLLQVAHDARIAADSPATRIVLSDQPEPVVENAKRLLAEVLSSFMERRPHYAQMRLIGTEDYWRELVRINRGETHLETVSAEKMQQKGNEPYLATITRFAPGEQFFTRISLNKEHGVVQGPAMLRLVTPVFRDQGQLAGAIVINVLAEQLFGEALIADGTDVTVVTGHGDHITIGAHVETPKFLLHGTPEWSRDPFADFQNEPGLKISGDLAFHTKHIEFLGVSEPVELRVVTHMPAKTITGPIQAARKTEQMTALILLVISIAIALVIARLLTRPLTALAQRINEYETGQPLSSVPVTGNDEIARLARLFIAMGDRLATQNQELTALFEGAASPIVLVDRESRVIKVNKSTENEFGYEPGELVGQNLSCLMVGDISRKHQAYVAEFQGDTLEMAPDRVVWGRRKDGSVLALDISISRIATGDGDQIIGIMTDITARVKAEAELANSVAALERSNQELDQFAYVASHDLRAPLRVIENASSWLEEDLERHLTDDTRETLQLLRSRVVRMSKLLDDLLQHARIGRGQGGEAEITAEEIGPALREILPLPDGMELDIQLDGQDFAVPRAPIMVVLLNLIANASKHHDRPGGRIEVKLDGKSEAVEISVTDDGPGIAPEYHEKIFEMFQTLRPKDEVEASGMGLAIVRKHLRHAGGTVSVQSGGNRGTTFKIVWPIAPTDKLAA